MLLDETQCLVPQTPSFLSVSPRRCRRPSTATSVWWSLSTWAAATFCGATAPSCGSFRTPSARPIRAGRRPAAAWRAGSRGCTLRSCSVRSAPTHWRHRVAVVIKKTKTLWWSLCPSCSGVSWDTALPAAVARSGREHAQHGERQRRVDGALRLAGAPGLTGGECTANRLIRRQHDNLETTSIFFKELKANLGEVCENLVTCMGSVVRFCFEVLVVPQNKKKNSMYISNL